MSTSLPSKESSSFDTLNADKSTLLSNETTIATTTAKTKKPAQLSFMERCALPLGSIVVDNLTTQFSISNQIRNPNGTGSRQCSWFAVGVLERWADLISCYNRKDFEGYRYIYHEVLTNATNNKANSATSGDIETLFHPAILRKHNKSNILLSNFKRISLNEDIEDSYIDAFMNQFPNASEVKETKLSFPAVSLDQLSTDLLGLCRSRKAMVVNRLSLSIAIFPLLDPESSPTLDDVSILVVDSHTTTSAAMSVRGAVRYILNSAEEENLLIIYCIQQ